MLKRLNILWLALLVSSQALATRITPESSDVSLKDETEIERFQCILAPEYTTLSSGEDSLWSIGVQGAFLVALGENWQAGLGFRQAFSGTGVSTLFTEIDLRASYALTGSNVMKRREISVNDETVLDATTYGEGGLRLDFYIPQYFFNLQDSVLPLSGFGAGVHYEFPSSSGFGFLTGARIDYVTSGELTVHPIQLFLGLNFWL